MPSISETLKNLVSRQMEEDRSIPVQADVSNPAPDAPPVLPKEIDPVLDTIARVVNGIKSGKDISNLTGDIQRLISNQEDRAELLNNLLMTHDYDRLVKYIKARKNLEDFLMKMAERDDLSPAEALVLHKIVAEESEIIYNRVKSGATSVKDVVALLNKVDYTLQASEKEMAQKFSKTTPQGREIVRKVIFRLNKMAQDKK